ncbi:HAD-IIA family hydrolase [Candidatus Nanohalococcus occultus]|uniref:HAD-IIA family hydrolase n=1 Tax=Candidatus Nanohalococcus occultus TaxID=2978047 RepID=UPI0039E02693
MDISEADYFFIDLEGTLIKWNDTIIGAEELVHTLREKGKTVYFHTDNSLLSRSGFAHKLQNMGIDAKKDEIITSAYSAARYLERKNVREVYAIGERGLIQEISNKGISTSRECENVLIGLDRQFNYSKLKDAAEIAESGNVYVCSDEKQVYAEKFFPHQLAINNAVETFAESSLLGKPSNPFIDALREKTFVPDKTVFIGDRMSDVETGKKLGVKTALVMSGETTRSDLMRLEDSEKPDFGVSNLTKLTGRL